MRQFLTISTLMLAMVLWTFTAKADFLSVVVELSINGHKSSMLKGKVLILFQIKGTRQRKNNCYNLQ